MATFSENQVRHFYVGTAVKDSKVTASDTKGTIRPVADTAKSHLYFEISGKGGLTRTDLIDIKNIMSAKATKASALATPLKGFKVQLDSTVNGGAVVAGQDYLLRIAFRQAFGMSDEDQYFKYGCVHGYSGMTASEFYKTLAKSLALNFSRELTKLVEIQIHSTAGGDVVVTPNTTLSASDYTYVLINEVEQEWTLGVKPLEPVYFTVQPSTITVTADERIWGTVTAVSAGTVADGKKVADLEYFCMGERGDIYRKVGFPHVINTEYLINPELEYHLLDIHYFYEGANEAVQKSEKTITIAVAADVVAEDDDSNSTIYDTMNSLISAINTAAGTSIAALS